MTPTPIPRAPLKSEKTKATEVVATAEKVKEERYAKSPPRKDLPSWAKEMREKSNFMPMRVKPMSYTNYSKVLPTYHAQVYAPVTATETQTSVGNVFFKPTEDVATKLKQEYNLWQDIKNIGGSIVHKGGSVLMGAFDLIARPGYVMRNVYKQQLQDKYAGPDKKGDVTGWEAILGAIDFASPVGIVKDIKGGTLDDRLKAGWRGLSGQDKVWTKDIMKVTNPEFVEKHPTGAFWAGLTGDLLLDPINFVGMAAAPGTITRALSSGGARLVGEKEIAARLWSETLFTKTGREAGKVTVKRNIKQNELNRLARKERRTTKKITKKQADKFTLTLKSEAALQARKAELGTKFAAKYAEDLKGSQLAWKVFKKSLPTLGIMTASRYNTGSRLATALKGENTLKQLGIDFNTGVADDLAADDKWQALFTANKMEDFKYEFRGTTYTVEFSKDKSVKDFIFRASQEANPIAAYQEYGNTFARARAGHINVVEARSRAFVDAFREHTQDMIINRLDDATQDAYNVQRGMMTAAEVSKAAKEKDLKVEGILRLKEEDLEKMTYTELKDKAALEWALKHPHGFREKKAFILLSSDDGKTYKKVSLRTINDLAKGFKSARDTRNLNRLTLSQRSPQRRAMDDLSGYPDEVIAARDRYVAAANNVRAKRETATAEDLAAEEAAARAFEAAKAANITANTKAALAANKIVPRSAVYKMLSKLEDLITGMGDFTDVERAKYLAILNDESMPLEARVAKVLNHTEMSNDEVTEILADTFKVFIDDTGVIHIPKNGTLADIPEVIKTVIRDRFQARVGPEVTTASGISLEDKPLEGIFKIKKDFGEPGTVRYMQDINSELGMMILDGYRTALQYAAQTDLWKDPEALFDTVHRTMSDFMDLDAADLKSQVAQLLYKQTGIRLPEEFVPKATDIQNIIGNKGMQWTKANGEVANQEVPWQTLAITMQSWYNDVFKFLGVENLGGKNGFNLDELIRGIIGKSNVFVTPHDPTASSEAISKASGIVGSLLMATVHLEDMVIPIPINGTTGVVNRFNFIDFILHSEAIVATQNKTVRVAQTPKGLLGRPNMGRLSALDSFTAIDDETIKALEAITELKRLANGKDKILAAEAQKALAKLFVRHGGISYLHRLRAPEGGTLANLDLTSHFNSLGAHVRLKQTVNTDRSIGFDAKYSADLLESMWGQKTLFHEWQKSFQNMIVHEGFVKGANEGEIVARIQRELDAAFANYDNLKKLIHPNGAQGYAPKDVLQKDINLTEPAAAAPQKFGPDSPEVQAITPVVQGYKDIESTYATLEQAQIKLKEAMDKVAAGPKDDPVALDELKVAREEYLKLKQIHESSVGATTGGAAGPATTNIPDPTDPANFGNVADEAVNLTDAERDVILGLIAKGYATNPPEETARQLHAFSMAWTHDVTMAQARLIAELADFNITYKSSIRFMGIPFMPIKSPMNVTHTVAGVTALDDQASRATKFFNKVADPKGGGKRQTVYEYFSKMSHLFEGTLEDLRLKTVNNASMSRRDAIKFINIMHSVALRSKYNNAVLQGMNRQKKVRYINEQMFTPIPVTAPNPLKQFELSPGENPVQDIAANFFGNAEQVFVSRTTKGRAKEIDVFNTYILDKYKLTDDEVLKIGKMIEDGIIPENLMPYSMEWLRQVGNLFPSSNLSTKKLLNINLPEFHYAMQDAKIKVLSGIDLHNGVFDQFATKMDPLVVKMLNDKVRPSSVDTKGLPLRGKLVNVRDISAGSEFSISRRYIPAKYLDGNHYISADVLPDVKLLFEYFQGVGRLADQLDVNFIDKVLTYFKASVTIYKIPTYPVRNTISDVFMAAMDGLTNPLYYKYSAELINDNHNLMKDVTIEKFNGIINESLIRDSVARAAHDPDSVLTVPTRTTPWKLHVETQQGGITLNGTQVMEAFNSLGLRSNRVAGEIPQTVKASRLKVRQRAGWGVHDKLRQLNDIREDWARMAHFIYAIEREAPLGGGYEDVIRRAAWRVKKYHFDYDDISRFDRVKLGKWVPFYKWIKNVIPFTITAFVTKPWTFNAEKAITQGIGYAVNDDKEDPRTDFVLPEWMKYDMATPVGSFQDPNGDKFGQYASLYLPLSDTAKGTLGPILNPILDPNVRSGGPREVGLQMGEGVATVFGGMSNPLIKSGIQAMTNKEIWASGSAPEKGDWLQTLANVIPGWATAGELKKSGENLSTDETETGKNQTAALLKALGAMRLHDNTEKNQLSEMNRRDDYYRQQFNDRKAEILKKFEEKLPKSTPEQRDQLLDALIKEMRKGDPNRL